MDIKHYRQATGRVLSDLPTKTWLGKTGKGIKVLGIAQPIKGPQVVTLTFKVHNRDIGVVTRDSTAERFASAAAAPSVRVWRDHGLIRIEYTLPRPEWREVPFAGLPQTGNGLTVGQKALGPPARLSFGGPNPHKAVFGTTRSGKSVFLADIILSIVKRDPDAKKSQLLILNPKPEPFLKKFDRLPHLVQPIANNPQAATKLLRWAVAEMSRRGDDPQRQARRLYIICDEFANVARTGVEASDALRRLSEMGGGLGVHLVVASQSANPSTLGKGGTAILANMPARVVFQLPREQSYQATGLSGQHTERLGGDGDALAIADGQPVRLRTAIPNKQDFDSLPRVEAIPAPPRAEELAGDRALAISTDYHSADFTVDELGKKLAWALVKRGSATAIRDKFGGAMTTARLLRDLAKTLRLEANRL